MIKELGYEILEWIIDHLILLGVLFVLFLIGSGIAYTVAVYQNDETYEVKVTDTITKRDGDSDTYLIFAEDQEGEIYIFKNADAMFAGKYDSSDLQARLKKGSTYEFETIGFRIPFMSEYKNVLEAKEVE